MASAGGIIALVLFALAFVSIARDPHTRGMATGAWIFAALVLPIVGPLLWFVIGKRYPYGISGQ